MSEQSDRLREARERAGFKTAAEAARTFGWHPDSYKSNENGIRGLTIANARKYGRGYRVDAEWLLFGKSPPKWRQVPSPMKQVSTVAVPEISLSSVVRYCTHYPSTEGVIVITERDLEARLVSGKGSFWLKLEDDSMVSVSGPVSFSSGDVVAFDLGAPVKPGDFVVAVADGGGDPVLRKAQLRTAGAGAPPSYDLTPLNPDYPTLHISGTGDGHILARAVAHTKAL